MNLPGPSEPLVFGGATADLANGVLLKNGRRRRLSALQVSLLRYLAERPGVVVPRDELLREVWGHKGTVVTRAVDLTVSRLRQALGPASEDAAQLVAVHGEGYALVLPPSTRPPDSAASGSAEALQTEPLVGREDSLEFLERWLSAPAGGWLSVVGPPGVGKSRLAQELVQRARAAPRERFADGVALVRLDGEREVEVFVAAFVRAVGLRVGTLGDPFAQVGWAMRETRCLVVLDDVDGVRDHVVALREALTGCPGVVVLTTSRRSLDYPGEARLSLRPLSADAAARLFAVATKGGVADLAHLGGIPLGVLLAAAAWRAGQPLDSSVGADLDAAIRKSWDRLSEESRRVLACLGVFQGGFDEVAVSQVAEASPEELAGLVDESLVDRLGGRHRLHPVVRAFARRELAARADAEEVAQRHVDWVLGLLGPELLHLRGAPRRRAVETVLDLLGDIEVAWQRSLRAGQGAALARSADALAFIMMRVGLWRAGERWFRLALESPWVEHTSDEDAELRIGQARCLARLGQGGRAWELLEGLRSVEPALGVPVRIRLNAARILSGLAIRPDAELSAAAAEAIRLCEGSDAVRQRCVVDLATMGFRLALNVRPPTVDETHAVYLAAQSLGDPDLVSNALHLRGLAHFRVSYSSPQALADLRRSRLISEEEGDDGPLAFSLFWEVAATWFAGLPEEAERLSAQTERLFKRHGALLGLWQLRRNGALAKVELGRFDEAEADLRACIEASGRLELWRLHAGSHDSLGMCLVLAGKPDAVAGLVAAGEAIRQGRFEADGVAGWVLALARLDDAEAMRAAAREGLRQYEASGSHTQSVRVDLEVAEAVARARLEPAFRPWPALLGLLEDPQGSRASRGVGLWLAARTLAETQPEAAANLWGYASRQEPFRADTPEARVALEGRLLETLGADAFGAAVAAGGAMQRAELGPWLAGVVAS